MPSPGPFPKPTGLVQCFVSARIATRKIRWSVRATRGRPVAGMRGPLPINEAVAAHKLSVVESLRS
jgi:hypothetical protein